MKTDFITPDFLLESDAARELYHNYAEGCPIADFHNHLDVGDLLTDRKHSDIGEFWVCADKYKHRAMRIAGIDEELITGKASNREKFDAWCSLMPYTIGNPLFHWSCIEMKEIFGIDEVPSAENAGEIWSECNARLATSQFSSNALLRRMNVKYLTTSDDIMDDVSRHKEAGRVAGFSVTPSLRADSALAFGSGSFTKWMDKTGADKSLDGYLEFLKSRLDVFSANGCRLSDHALDNGFRFIRTDRKTASEIFSVVLKGRTPASTDLCCLQSFVLEFLAKEYAYRGYVMQLHIGAERWTSSRLRGIAGPAWWYNDHKYGIEENLKSLSSYSLLSRSVGMTTDSRTILSFSRHAYFRRILCNYIGRMVENGEIPGDMGFLGEIIKDISYRNAEQWIYGNEQQ